MEIKTAVVTIAVATFGWEYARWAYGKVGGAWRELRTYPELLARNGELEALIGDFPRRESEAVNEGRRQVLLALNSITAKVAGPVRILGIASSNGTVALHLDRGSQHGIRPEQLLLVRRAFDGEVWGVIQVTEVDNCRCRAVPVDRKNVEFWERLEDRMGYDPAPPQGVQVDTYSMEQLLSLMGIQGETP